MENKLNQYISREFHKIQTEHEQRRFIENFRFLMMANDLDFQNYYSNKVLDNKDFYSVVDMLYQLNNFWMLSEFLHQNREFLFREVNKMTNFYGEFDFSEPCRYGKDTVLSRIFQVLNGYSSNVNMVAEKSPTYNINTHKLKVYSTTIRNNQVPQIILQGKWVEKFGFSINSNIRVECYDSKFVILKEDSI